MFALGMVRKLMEGYAGSFDAALLSGAQAEAIVADAAAIENMASVIKAMAAARVAECGTWRSQGDRSAAHQLARLTGVFVSRARDQLATAGRLKSLPAVDGAARRGELSASQLVPLADAADAAPDAEGRLLELARGASVGELADECARTKAAAKPSDDERQKAIHASRYLRRRRCADGAGELRYRSTLEEVAQIFAVAQGFAAKRFHEARASGEQEPEEAYLADGLRDAVLAGAGAAPAAEPMGPFDGGPVMGGAGGGDAGGGGAGGGAGSDSGAGGPAGGSAGGAGGGDEAPATAATPAGATPAPPAKTPAPPKKARNPVPTKVLVRIDWDALMRGHTIAGEVCEIDGLGPVPVPAVRAMVASGDAFLAAVVTRGEAVARVAHLRRRPNAAQRSALEWTSPVCAVVGCNTSLRLENDHGPTWASSRITMVEYLNRTCGPHHQLKTERGWDFVAGVGKRAFVSPDDPRHPRHEAA